MLTNNAGKKIVRNGVYFTILTYKIFKKGKFVIFFDHLMAARNSRLKPPCRSKSTLLKLYLSFHGGHARNRFQCCGEAVAIVYHAGGQTINMANIGQKKSRILYFTFAQGMPLLENINMTWRDTATSKSHYFDFEIRAENGSLRRKT